jgi:hypothetical protein
MQKLRLGCIALVLAGHGKLASADEGPSPYPDAPTALIVYGDASAADRATVAAAFTAVLNAIPWRLDDHAVFSESEIAHIGGCTIEDRPWTCVSVLARPKGIERVVVVEVTPHPHEKQAQGAQANKGVSQTVVYGTILSAPDDVAPSEAAYCPRCTSESLHDAANNLALRIVQAYRDMAITRARSQQDTHGAPAPQPPGPHPRLHPKQQPIHYALTWPIALVSAGVVTMIGGGIGLAFNQHSETVQPPAIQRHYYRDTEPGSIAALASGAVVAAVGGALWLYFHHENSHAAPAVALESGGAVLSVRGSF